MEENGGSSEFEPHQSVPPSEVVVTIPFLVKPLFKDKEFLHHKYCVEGLSLAQIAAEICSSKEAVRKGLQRFSIELRRSGQPHGHPSQPRFGVRIVKGKSVPHQAESKVMMTACELRLRGLTLREIANEFTKQGIPTKNRRHSWHPEMVNRILRPKSDSMA